jgi:hypothetical protein
MAPKRASSKADEAAKAALLAEKKGKALALVDTTHQEATEDDAVVEQPELFQLKCPSRTLKGSNTLKQE